MKQWLLKTVLWQTTDTKILKFFKKIKHLFTFLMKYFNI